MSARSARVARTTHRKAARASSFDSQGSVGTPVVDRPMRIESPRQWWSMMSLDSLLSKDKP